MADKRDGAMRGQRDKERLLAEAAAALREPRSQDAGHAATATAAAAAAAAALEDADWRVSRSVRELERQLSYVRWRRSQNQARMRDTIQYTKALEARDIKERFEGESRADRLLDIEDSEMSRPLHVSRQHEEAFAQQHARDVARARARKAAIERERERVRALEAFRAQIRDRNSAYREARHILSCAAERDPDVS